MDVPRRLVEGTLAGNRKVANEGRVAGMAY